MSIVARRSMLLLSAASLAEIATGQTRPGHVSADRADAQKPAATDVVRLGTIDWLRRMHAASRQHSYVGTFVVSAATGNLSSARIWHVVSDGVLMERIESLSGAPRSTFRRNGQVMTFFPEDKIVKSEKRENLDFFPNLPGAPDSTIGELYDAQVLGKGRVAGLDADVVQLMPRDGLRFGYRVWSERRSGLVIALQTVDREMRVVEQSAFSELQFNAPVKAQALQQMMGDTTGYRIEKSELERTTAAEQGWSLRQPVAGFRPVNCYRRLLDGGAGPERTMQWTFSDGLATVSLFVEPYDAKRPSRELTLALGATYTLTRRLTQGDGDWWLTAVGEVPAQTLDAFAQGLVRLR
jgi:sigma-E factor negative regulatory protein RseB